MILSIGAGLVIRRINLQNGTGILGCFIPALFFVLHRGLQIGVPNNVKLPCIFYFTRKKIFRVATAWKREKNPIFRDFLRKFTVPLRKKITGFRGMIDIVLIYVPSKNRLKINIFKGATRWKSIGISINN